jgi:NADH-quinone oxidoreductase subunit L
VGAYSVAIFHLYTHAFFKACLFLGAGSVIHALGGEQDIRKMGGLARKIPVTFVTFAVATGAIAGLPPLAGFFSKDEILWFAFASSRGGSALLFGVTAGTALLTSFYMFRLLWLTFFGPSRMDAKAERHVHESPRSMTAVLIVLALLSAVGGFLALPHFLAPLLPLPEVHPELEHLETPLVVVSVILGLGGLAGAAFFFGGNAERAERLRRAFPALHRLLAGKYFVDEAYNEILDRPLYWIADRVFLKLGDQKLFDGSLHGLAALGRRTAGAFIRVQNGNLHLYVLLVLFGIIASLALSWRHG